MKTNMKLSKEEAEYKTLKDLRIAAASFGIKNVSRKDKQTITEEIESIKLSVTIASQKDPNMSSVIITQNDNYDNRIKKEQNDLRLWNLRNEELKKQNATPRRNSNKIQYYYENGKYKEISPLN